MANKSKATVRDPITGRRRRPWVFRMTLGHSQHGYEEAVWDQRLETFLGLHERAFRDLAGVPLVVRRVCAGSPAPPRRPRLPSESQLSGTP